MHIGTLKKLALALTLWLGLHMSSLRAQIFTDDLPLQANTTGTNPVDFEFRSDGTLIAKGNYGVGSLVSGDQGAGTRMLWYPALGAFRAGRVNGTYWDLSNLGTYSVALGNNTTASGFASTAFGSGNVASGNGSVALGNSTTASGRYTLSSGFQSEALGDYAEAFGAYSTASGDYSMAIGGFSTATGVYSTTSGLYTTASAYGSFVVGISNVGLSETGSTPGGTDPEDTDPLFEVGNGYFDSEWHASDALVVFRNGDTKVQGNMSVGGVITTAPGGDIPMFSGD